MTKLTQEMLQEELKRNGGNLSKAARTLGLNYAYVSEYHSETTLGPFSGFELSKPEPEDITTLGRPALAKHVIAIKRIGTDLWPKKYLQVIKKAREDFNNGTHIMCQGRKDGWVVLYSIPRLVAKKPRKFF